MAGNIKNWLEYLDLVKYADVFIENEVGLRDLPHITEDDLKELGLPLGPRRRIMAAIPALIDSAAPPSGEAIIVEQLPVSQSERRQLTVMFCDLVGSTALSRQLDPEDLRDVIRRYQDAVSGAVTRYGGHIARYLGDGVLAYFGWPQAYEDQAERAVRAGLDAVSAVNLVQVADKAALEARVGIATGQVVVGDIVGERGRDANAVSGETPNLAARLQQVAGPGQVVVDEVTHRLLGQTFAVDDLGTHALKGFDDAVQAWGISGEVVAESRFEATHSATLTHFVGRDTELQLLLDRWQLAAGGEGQVVLISGEAGIGKSRLIQGLRDQVAHSDHIRIRCQCSPYHTNSALYPTIQHLEQAADFSLDDDGDVKLDKLEAVLRQADDDIEAQAPLFANLLSLPYEARYGALTLPRQQIKEQILEALVTQLLQLAEHHPVLFLFEDTHWIDPTSQELLERIIGRLQEARVLFVITHRPEWQPAPSGHNNVTSLQLNRLGKAHGAHIVRAIAGDHISDNVVMRIVARTDGVPLFIEELTKLLVEGGLDIVDADIPATLQASLTERLDRLGEAKEIAQIGAVIGRQFSHTLLTAVAEKPATELSSMLGRLVQSELIFCRGEAPDAVYSFKHALVQDTAYDTLLISRRRQLHAQIAAKLKEQIPEISKVEPEVLAHHYTVAGSWVSAIGYWQKAGTRASHQSANREAVAHFSKGLELLPELPTESDRNELDLELQLALGPSLMHLIGWSRPEVRSTYERAQRLCKNAADDPRRFTATWGLWMHCQAISDHRQARNLTKQLLEYAEDTSSDYALQAQHACWTTSLYTGELAAARDHCTKGIALYDFDKHRDHAFSYAGHDPGVCGYGQGAVMDWLLGRPEQALKSAAQSEALADRLGYTGSSAHALSFSARLFSLLRNFEATKNRAEACMTLAETIGAETHVGSSKMLAGWACVHLSEADYGLALMQEGNARLDAIGQYSSRPHFLALYTEACMLLGEFEEAERRLQEAIDLVERCDERYMEGELRRLTGSLWLAGEPTNPIEAEKHFLRALKVSSVQGAKSFELRAACDLARLWHEQGKIGQARDLLAPLYGWFAEGFDTPDLKDAKTLLNELD